MRPYFVGILCVLFLQACSNRASQQSLFFPALSSHSDLFLEDNDSNVRLNKVSREQTETGNVIPPSDDTSGTTGMPSLLTDSSVNLPPIPTNLTSNAGLQEATALTTADGLPDAMALLNNGQLFIESMPIPADGSLRLGIFTTSNSMGNNLLTPFVGINQNILAPVDVSDTSFNFWGEVTYRGSGLVALQPAGSSIAIYNGRADMVIDFDNVSLNEFSFYENNNMGSFILSTPINPLAASANSLQSNNFQISSTSGTLFSSFNGVSVDFSSQFHDAPGFDPPTSASAVLNGLISENQISGAFRFSATPETP